MKARPSPSILSFPIALPPPPPGKLPETPRSTFPAKKATIYDLARLVNVSPGTVSRVLNNRSRVNPQTRDRVLHAASTLNLKPRAAARFRQAAILSEPTYSDRIEGYAATLTAHLSYAFSRRNIGVVLPANPLEKLPGLFLDGIIAVTFNEQLQTLLAGLENRMHVVYMDKFDATEREYAICSDHFDSGYLAAHHFIARGKKRLGFLGCNNLPTLERLAGFRKALIDAEVPADERIIVLTDPGTSHISAVTRVVRGGADCVYVPGSSFQAMECLHILSYVMGLRVPQDISIIGGENEGISSIQNPPLTTIHEPLREMAECAAELFDQLTAGTPVAVHRTILPVKLIERNSVI